jgi:hypothetical protein
MNSKKPLAEVAAYGVTPEPDDPSLMEDAKAAEGILGVIPKAPATSAELAHARAEVQHLSAAVEQWEVAEMTTITATSQDLETTLALVAAQLGTHTAQVYRDRLRSMLKVSIQEARAIRAIVNANLGQGVVLEQTPLSAFHQALVARLRQADAKFLTLIPKGYKLPVAAPMPNRRSSHCMMSRSSSESGIALPPDVAVSTSGLAQAETIRGPSRPAPPRGGDPPLRLARTRNAAATVHHGGPR